MDDSDAIYVKRLSSVLKLRDVDALREFLEEEASARDEDRVVEIEMIPDAVLEARMYKMILARQDLRDLHAEARRWLNEHGQDVMS